MLDQNLRLNMKTRDVSNTTVLPALEVWDVLVLGNKECLQQPAWESRKQLPS